MTHQNKLGKKTLRNIQLEVNSREEANFTNFTDTINIDDGGNNPWLHMEKLKDVLRRQKKQINRQLFTSSPLRSKIKEETDLPVVVPIKEKPFILGKYRHNHHFLSKQFEKIAS